MRGRLCFSFLVLAQSGAHASPWVQEDGGVYSRLALSSEQLDGLSAQRADGYVEYGLSQNWTLTAKAEAVRFNDADDFNSDSWRVTARRKLLKWKGWVGAVEAGMLDGGAFSAQNSCETLGAEARASLGWSGKWRKASTFTFAEVAGRFHEGCERQRAEFGLGQQATKNIWTISQVWIERGSDKASSDKVQTELLWRHGRLDLSIGYRQELGARFDEEAVFVAAVRRF